MGQNLKELNYCLDIGAFSPLRAHDADAGLDLRAKDAVLLKAHSSAIFDTGVHIDIPMGYVGFLKAKSGLNIKHNIIGTGVVDAGYTGSIVVKLYNLGDTDHSFQPGDKIIQFVVLPIETPTLRLVDSFTSDASDRGAQGFGSTGK